MLAPIVVVVLVVGGRLIPVGSMVWRWSPISRWPIPVFPFTFWFLSPLGIWLHIVRVWRRTHPGFSLRLALFGMSTSWQALWLWLHNDFPHFDSCGTQLDSNGWIVRRQLMMCGQLRSVGLDLLRTKCRFGRCWSTFLTPNKAKNWEKRI